MLTCSDCVYFRPFYRKTDREALDRAYGKCLDTDGQFVDAETLRCERFESLLVHQMERILVAMRPLEVEDAEDD